MKANLKEATDDVIKGDIQRCHATIKHQNGLEPTQQGPRQIIEELSDSIADSVEPLPTETPPANRRATSTSSTPGAYHTNATSTRIRPVGKTPLCVLGAGLRMANKPGQDLVPPIRRRQQQEEEEQQATDDPEALHNLTVASPVVEELLKDLQRAEEMDPELASRKSWKSASSRHSRGDGSTTFSIESNKSNGTCSVYWKAGIPLLLLVGITLLLAFTLTNTATPIQEEETTLVAPSSLPTLAPTSLENYASTLLPTSTLRMIQDDPTSPQAQAHQWLLLDPNLHHYSQQRLIQRFALATLFYSTAGFTWHNSSQWLSYHTHECQWYTRSTFAMKEMIQYVYDGYLTEIPDKLDKCNPHGILQHLWLDSNHLVGTLPEELYLMTSLQTLSMGLNPGFGGTIGTQIGLLTNLEGLALYHCPHGGSIPSQIGLLTNLKALGINDNGHTGTIPMEIYHRLTNLQTITLARNYLTGTIPTTITSLSKLRWFVVDESNLHGPIPSQIGQLSHLEWLVVGGNQLSNTLPTQLGQLSNLLMLSLFQNQFSGTLPSELGQMTSTTLLSFRANKFHGTIPTEYGLLTKLTLALNFQDNPQLVGTIPSQLGMLTNLMELSFLNNGHTGHIPSQLGHLTDMRRLSLGHNSFNGSIPSEFTAFAPTLYALNLQGNPLLEGTVPPALCNINATCVAGSLNPCEGLVGLQMDCTELLCGCGECTCPHQEDQKEDSNSNGTTLVILSPQD